MLKVGLIMLAVAAVCLLGSYTPILGPLFILPFADLVLIALALMICAALPVRNAVRGLLVVALWIGGSLGVELARLPQHLSGAEGLLRPQVVVHKSLNLARGQPVALHGDTNPFLAAAGPVVFVTAETRYGARISPGRALINAAATIDLEDLLAARGRELIIGHSLYPRLVVKRTSADGWSRLNIRVEAAPGQLAGEFHRTFPLPRPFPGVAIGDKLGLSIFHDNMLRRLLGWNTPVYLHHELTRFLDEALGLGTLNTAEGASPTLAFRLERESLKPIAASTYLSAVLESLRRGIKIDREANRIEVCGMVISNMEFGDHGGRTYAAVMAAESGADPVVLGHVTPDNAAFDYYCDEGAGRLLTFIATGSPDRPVLKVSTYSQQGVLLGVQRFGMPFWLHRTSVVTRGSWQRLGESKYRFSVSSPLLLQVAPHEVADKTHYRYLEFESTPSSGS